MAWSTLKYTLTVLGIVFKDEVMWCQGPLEPRYVRPFRLEVLVPVYSTQKDKKVESVAFLVHL